MTKYRVFGKAIRQTHFKHICDCEYCEVQYSQAESTREIIEDIEASDEDEAIRKVESTIDNFLAWSGVEAIPLIPHERPPLSAAGERELLRRWQAGEGLSGEAVR